jgi:cobalt-precorrin-6B (C15)-methyltransferase
MDNKRPVPGLRDSGFLRGNVPMTKQEIRVITLAKLDLEGTGSLLDIGAGTGSVALEAARLLPGGTIYALEKNPEAVTLIRENARAFHIQNIVVLEGTAPLDTFTTPVERVFIGGSGPRLGAILEWMDRLLLPGGIVVANAVTLETMTGVNTFLQEKRYTDRAIIQVQVHSFTQAGTKQMFAPSRPVFILEGRKP